MATTPLSPSSGLGAYNTTQPTWTDGQSTEIQTDNHGNTIVVGGGSAGTPTGGIFTVQTAADGATLSKAAVTMSGSSATLVGASATRLIVMVSSVSTNSAVAIDPTGGSAALTAGIALAGGQTLIITGKAAQSAMTQIGTNTQLLTVYTG